ncbi:MAG: pyruvate dehydrogenase (acetyl-transferring) E1 component subunit alpha [Bacteroidetes bacterium]|nr:pyruvate dehydrogenase (acetyl-transferring) E1 component subunit alpha [Bacteroidota bacterium]
MNIPKNVYLKWYESMLLIRKFEIRAAQMYGQQKIKGFCHLYNGQEACIVGAVSALTKNDKFITAYRDHAHPIALGIHPKYVMAELFGKITGVSKGMGGSMHMFSKEKNFLGGHGIVGGQIPLGVGIAFAEKYKKTKNLCITYMGDGAVRQGAFHESLNLAMLYKLPIIFAIENNGYAMGTSVQRSSNVTDLYKLGASYDMESLVVDGLKVDEVHKTITKIAKKVRTGIPILLEIKTYRYKGHSVSDPANYRDKKELEKFQKKDSIEYIKALILKKKIGSEKEIEKIDNKVTNTIKESIEFADKSEFPKLEDAINCVYEQKDYKFLKE